MTPTNQKLAAAILVLTGMGAFSNNASADPSYPNRTITMIVPFAAGGATDTIARIVAQGMSKELGQTIIIENVGGAGGTTGSIRAKNATPDGYTILAGHMGTHSSAFSLYKKPAYDPRSDFSFIGHAASAPIVIFSYPGFDAKSLKELAAKIAKPDGANVAHSGVGSNAHLTCKLFSSIAKGNPTEIPYRGNGPLMADLLSGKVDYSCDQIITLISFANAGKIRPIAIAATKRSPLLPNVPTSAEQGYPEYLADAWTAIFAPKGVPADIIAKLNKAYAAALGKSETSAALEKLGAVLPAANERTSAHLEALVKRDVERWGKIIRDAKISID